MKRIDEYDESWFAKQTPAGLALKVIGTVVVLGIIVTLIGLPLGWFNKGVEIVSPANVEVQYTQLETDYHALEATAGNVCGLSKAKQEATDPDERAQRSSQVLATEQNYRRIKSEYDARWANAFQAKYVGPNHLPTTAPTLEQMMTQACPNIPTG